MTLEILLVGVAIGGFVIFAYIREVRKSAKLENKHEISEAENEAIQKNIKAAKATEHRIVTASNSDLAKLRQKWTRKN